MKLERINTEIEKTKSKIGELQARLRELEQKKTEAENIEIVAMVRSIELMPAELAEFIKAFRQDGRPPAFVTGGGYPGDGPMEQEEPGDEE